MFTRFARTLAVLLLAWQAMVAQTHLHMRVLKGPAVASVVKAVPTAPQRPEGPLDCPLCREVAHAGPYLSPGTILFQPPAPVAEMLPVAVLSAFGVGSQSHVWRSRAPPALRLS